MAYLYRWWYSHCWRWNLCWIGCDFPITTWTNLRFVWPRHYHWSSSCVVWCQNSLHQHRWTDRHVWSIVVSWFSWSCHSWWTVTFFSDSIHAAGSGLGTNLAPNTRPAGAGMSTIYDPSFSTGYGSPCSTCMVTVENWVNECADHAAARGTFGLISNHSDTTRWTRRNFDTFVCPDGCNNIKEILDRLQHIRTNAATLHQDWVQCWFFSSWPLCLLCTSRVFSVVVFSRSRVFVLSGSLLSPQVMDRLSSSSSTTSSINDHSEHNTWKFCWTCFSSSKWMIFSTPSFRKSTLPHRILLSFRSWFTLVQGGGVRLCTMIH